MQRRNNTFDSNRFEQQLNAQLTGKAVGFEYAVYQGETLITSGAAGYAVISSQTKMTANRRMTVTSMSKTITATAVLRAMEVLGAWGKVKE